MKRTLLLGLAAAAAVALSTSSALAGAIFTTVKDGTIVNANHYDNCDDVYLNGGPQNNNAKGLPDGIYYFQVTDPSGGTLLSIDNAECRQVLVQNGRMSGAYTGNPAGSIVCAHANGDFNPANNTIPVQLSPFNQTPNNGGVYKAWLIKADAATVDPSDPRVLIFSHKDAKTDNFKCGTTTCTDCVGLLDAVLSGTKYQDCNGDGTFTQGEVGLGGWEIVITKPDGTTESITTDAATGAYSFTADDIGNYVICETPQAGYVQTGPVPGTSCGSGIPGDAIADNNSCWTLTLTAANFDGVFPCLDFFNLPLPVIHCPADKQLECGASTDPSNTGGDATATDACGTQPTIGHTDAPSGANCTGKAGIDRTWTATDGFDHTVSCVQHITFVDTTAPVISGPGNLTVNTGDNCCGVATFNVTAQDNCNGSVSVNCNFPSGTCFPVGTTKVTCNAQDACGNPATPYCFNVTVLGKISVHKFYDANTDGYDNDSKVVKGVQISITGPQNASGTTDSSGNYCAYLPVGTYTVSETVPSGSVNTTPTTVTGVNITPTSCKPSVSFGNVCLGAGGALSKGFWSNGNGQSVFKNTKCYGEGANDLFLAGLNLRDSAGSVFDPGSYAQFNSWIGGATAVNMAYMLSAQLAAMELNVRLVGSSCAGPFGDTVNGNALIYAPGTSSANLAGFASINAVMTEANTLLGTGGTTKLVIGSTSSLLAKATALKNALDNACNNLNFVQASACQ